MEIVDVGCPRSIDLTSINKKDKDTKLVLQTINIYDYISIKQDIKSINNVLIKSNNDITKTMKEKLNELLLLYSNYIGVKINNILIDINYNNLSWLNNDESILAGFLVALNYYFKYNVTNHELIYLANKIDSLISYYINGGYKKIDNSGKSLNFGNNPYEKYYLFEGLNKNIEYLDKIKEICNKYKIIFSQSNCDFITSKDIISSNVLIGLKRMFPDIKIQSINNVKEHKVLVKYLK